MASAQSNPVLLALPWYGAGIEPSDPVVFSGVAAWERFEGGKPFAPNTFQEDADEAFTRVEQEQTGPLTPQQRKKLQEEKRERDRQAKDSGFLKVSELNK